MELRKMSLTEFCAALSSDKPAPGGGSAAAMSAAMGISLTAMVANLTVGKKKYAEHDISMQTVVYEASGLQRKLIEAIDRDTQAYNGVAAVLAMPKATDADKAARAEAMEEALKSAALVPLEVMELCEAALALTEKILGKSNSNCASDLGVAALQLGAAAAGAWMNVLINLSGIKDEAFAAKVKSGGEAILAKTEATSKTVAGRVLAEI